MVGASFKRLSMVFPAWNEQEMLGRTARAANEIGERLVDDGEVAEYEVILVDDGSSDDTPALADRLAAEDGHVVAIHHVDNRGLGASIRTGFDAATGDVVLYTDADLPFDLLELPKALRLMRVYDADIVSMHRFDRTGEGPKRFVYSHVYNWLVRLVFDLHVRDVNFAGKLLRRDVLDGIELETDGSFIDVELLIRAERLGFTIVQFGVDYFPRSRGTSTLSSSPVVIGIVRDLVRWRRRLGRAGAHWNAGVSGRGPRDGPRGTRAESARSAVAVRRGSSC